MPDAYRLGEARFIQYRQTLVGAASLTASLGPVPKNCVWTILNALAYCSAAETQTYWFSIYAPDGSYYPVTLPASAAIAPAVTQWYPMLREGMELRMYPGEYLYVQRAAATAGSTLGIFARLIESPLPLFEEFEPQIQRKQITMPGPLVYRPSIYRVPASMSPGRDRGGEGGGGGGEPPPVY